MNIGEHVPTVAEITAKRDRRNFIGGSDVAAVLGRSPWKTPLDLYMEKIAPAPPPEIDRAVFRRGKLWEPIALEMLIAELEALGHGVQVIGRNRVYTDDEHPFMQCEIDAELLVNGEVWNCEIKTARYKSDEWGEADSEEIPIHYQAQAMQGLGITKRAKCIVGALFGADEIVPYWVEYDSETVQGIREKVAHFWHNHVQARVPPEPISLADILRLFAKVNGSPLEAPIEVLDDVKALRDIRNQIKTLEDDAGDVEKRLAEWITHQWRDIYQSDITAKDNAVITHKGHKVLTWKRQRGTHLDQQGLKAEQPETVKRLTKEHWFRVMRTHL